MEIGLLLSGIMLLIIATIAVIGLILFIVGITRQKKKNGLTISGAIVGGVFSLLYLILNPTGPSEITDEIEGIYKFTYPKGQVEILHIINDKTFYQTFYNDEGGFVNSKPIHFNKGTWSSSTDSKLNFYHWLTICYMWSTPDSIAQKPHNIDLGDISWYESSNEYPAYIDIWSDNGYILKKIEK